MHASDESNYYWAWLCDNLLVYTVFIAEKKINGELFLQLKEDPDFDDLQISHAFKKLISKKIDEVCYD